MHPGEAYQRPELEGPLKNDSPEIYERSEENPANRIWQDEVRKERMLPDQPAQNADVHSGLRQIHAPR